MSEASNFLSSGFNIGVAVVSLATNLTTLTMIVKACRHHKAKGPVHIRKTTKIVNLKIFDKFLLNYGTYTLPQQLKKIFKIYIFNTQVKAKITSVRNTISFLHITTFTNIQKEKNSQKFSYVKATYIIKPFLIHENILFLFC
jgi:hypothetical protein